eukprot:1728917-Lingulodinium_polyedra.AAC.1
MKDHSACQTAFRVAARCRAKPERRSRATLLDSWPRTRGHRNKRPNKQGVQHTRANQPRIPGGSWESLCAGGHVALW